MQAVAILALPDGGRVFPQLDGSVQGYYPYRYHGYAYRQKDRERKSGVRVRNAFTHGITEKYKKSAR
jgi:hypothetical protein